MNSPEAIRQVVIVGAGGHGREVFDAISAMSTHSPQKLEVLGFVSDSEPDSFGMKLLRAPLLGDRGILGSLVAEFIVAIGDGAVRREIDLFADALGRKAISVVHPRATIGTDAVVGPGCYLAPGAVVMTNARLGRHVHVNVNAVVSHDADVGSYTTLSPGVMINGAARVGSEVFFGTGAIVLPGRTVGDGAVIGAGAVVTTDIPDGVTAVGVPARWRLS